MLRPEVRRITTCEAEFSLTYHLAMQTVESIYYMWRFTGDFKWRHRGYEIYQAIEEHTRTEFGLCEHQRRRQRLASYG